MRVSWETLNPYDERDELHCPQCDATGWDADLMLPGGLRVKCQACGWQDYVKNIEKRIKARE